MKQIGKMKYSVCNYIHQKEGFTIDVSFGGQITKAAPVVAAVAAPVVAASAPIVVAVLAPVALVAVVGIGAAKIVEKLTEK